MNEKPKLIKKCWSVGTAQGDDYANVEVWADTREQARVKGLPDYNSRLEYKDIKAWRKPIYDIFVYKNKEVKRFYLKETIETHERLQKLQELPEGIYFIGNGYVGNDILFWAQGSCGYTCNFDNAHRYSKEELLKTFEKGIRHQDVVYSLEECMKGKRTVIDMQYVKRTL